jgi:hypothetical protein
MSEVVEALKNARARIMCGWTRGMSACDAEGTCVSPDDPSAVRWCAVGALDALPCEAEVFELAWTAVKQQVPRGPRNEAQLISTFNDQQESVEPVVHLFDRAITKLEAEDQH